MISVMRTYRKRRAAVALAGGSLALLAVVAATGHAHAATNNWNAQFTDADVVGAHAWGTVEFGFFPGGDSVEQAKITINVRDTATDSHGARAYLRVRSNWDGSILKSASVSASGKDDVDSTYVLVPRNGYGDIMVRENLTEQGADLQGYDSQGRPFAGEWDFPRRV